MRNRNTSRRSIKDSIELISTIKGRRLTKKEIGAITYLGGSIGSGDFKNDRKTATNTVNPPSDINHLKDSLKY